MKNMMKEVLLLHVDIVARAIDSELKISGRKTFYFLMPLISTVINL